MFGQNFVSVMGHVGQDVELTHTKESNVPVANVNIALNRRWTDQKTNEVKQQTTWVTAVCWNGWATSAAKYLKKGHPVQVEGRLTSRKYTDKEGVERYVLEITCTLLNLIKPNGNGSSPRPPAPTEADIPLGTPTNTAEPAQPAQPAPVPANEQIPG